MRGTPCVPVAHTAPGQQSESWAHGLKGPVPTQHLLLVQAAPLCWQQSPTELHAEFQFAQHIALTAPHCNCRPPQQGWLLQAPPLPRQQTPFSQCPEQHSPSPEQDVPAVRHGWHTPPRQTSGAQHEWPGVPQLPPSSTQQLPSWPH
jgi:hypothetical protein